MVYGPREDLPALPQDPLLESRRSPCSKDVTSQNRSSAGTSKSHLPPFRYFDKDNLAVVAKNFAVLQSGRFGIVGFFAWLVWALITQFLAENSLRFSVFFQWIWTYISSRQCDRLIIEQRKNA
jgi:hypothetical protein